MLHTVQNSVAEWAYTSAHAYSDPFHEVQLDVVVTTPDGSEQVVPTFWAGEQTWKVRYASPQVGTHTFRTVCSDSRNANLHGQTGTLEVAPYTGSNPLLRHGPLRIAPDRRHLLHHDGTPFFWLGDTWWMAFARRLRWPDDFRELTADRVRKGFTVIQIVAGLYPDMPAFDPRGQNEAGYPWEADFTRINPAYFDQVDLRMAHLVRAGLVPCLFGSWGYYLEVAGAEVLAQHFRYLIARYGAYPVVWCAAGEALMPYYLSSHFHNESEAWLAKTRQAWGDLIRTIRRLDPYGHPITIHPTRYGRQQVDDPGVMDFEMLQTGHSGYPTLAKTIEMLEESLAAAPQMPVLVGEVNYEGILESSREEMQRFLFWSCLLSGAAGHTYGANGVWQVNTTEDPYGISPGGMAWGHKPWDEAYALPGSAQIGLAKALLQDYAWWDFTPHPEWVTPHQGAESRMAPYAAGIPGEVRVIFVPSDAVGLLGRGGIVVNALEAELAYTGFFFDPATGTRYPLDAVTPAADGTYTLPVPPIRQDWVVVLERATDK